MPSTVYIVFRYDDYTAASSLEIEKKLFKIFEKYKIVITIGVVPFVTKGHYHDPNETESVSFSKDKTQFLIDSISTGCVDVALHGYNHKSQGSDLLHSEFAGRAIDDQNSFIKEGKDELFKLFNVNVNTFIPPWNTYDKATINCLIKNDINCISANRYGPYIENNQFHYLPITIEFHDLEKAITEARADNEDGTIISVLLHPYDFEGSGDDRASIKWKTFDDKMQWLLEQNSIKILSVEEMLNEEHASLNFNRFKMNKPGQLENIFFPFIKKTYDETCYKSFNKAAALKRKKHFLTVLCYFLLFTVVIIGVKVFNIYFLSDMKALSSFIKYGTLLSLVFFSLKFVRQRNLFFRSFLSLVFLLGVFIGITI